MKRLDFEEQANKKKALALSVVIHLLLVGYISYTGYKLISNLGSGVTEIDYLAEPSKGNQVTKFKELTAANNAKEQVKVRRANTKKKPKPKPKVKPIPKAVAVKKTDSGDVAVAQKKPKENPLPPKIIEPEPAEEKEDLQQDLAALAKENSIQKGPNAFDAGNEKADIREETGQFGDPNAVRSYLELTPIAGNRGPAYPNDARRRRYAPLVVIDYYVNPNGTVRNIRLVKPAELASINNNIIEAVKKWKFQPGKIGYFRQEFQFRLNQPAQIEAERLKRTTN